VGSELFTAAGPAIVRQISDTGAEVFLDLKFHDIPSTVGRAVRQAAALGVRLVTVHAAGGEQMLRAAVEAAGDETRCGVLAVTVLTSLDSGQVAAAWGREAELSITTEVLRLAGMAQRAGAHGVVCGGTEAGDVRACYGDTLAILVPGIRLSGSRAHDQARVATPAEAAAAGARYVVVGRTVTEAPDPAEAMRRVGRELGAAPKS
jgi:orotidine-5'-phosphate decarboxylase